MLFDLYEDMSSDCLLTEDIWDKFHFTGGWDMTQFEWNRGEYDSTKCPDTEIVRQPESVETKGEEKIRNHDCMWAGHCGSKEHSVEDIKNCLVTPIAMMNYQPTPPTSPPAPPLITPPVVPTKQSPIAPGRSLLLKTQPQQQQQQYMQQQFQQVQTSVEQQNALQNTKFYDSPPNSDDEESKSQVLQYLQEYISECDLDDEDLVDYFKSFEEEEDDQLEDPKPKIEPKPKPKCPTVQEQTSPATQKVAKHTSPFVSDHCYHKDKNDSMNMPETPSDSEEEIDVVSTDDKHLNPQRGVSALPTNPTTRDRQQIQKTMASAITKNGIRTLVPRKTGPGSIEHSPSKRRPDARGIKRNRHRMPTSPYKKQRSYHAHQQQLSSDSEQEPSEKRIEHNNMERQRRVDLRNAFEELRVLVPEVNKRERAPKVVILREAAVYCHKLTDVSDAMHRQVDEMRRVQKRLRTRLSQLRLSLAPKHR